MQSVAPEQRELPAEESDLIADAQEGDRRAFAVLVERYWERLYRWLFHLTRDSHAAEDLVQESFLKAFAALKSFRLGSNFRAWLFRIGHNNFINQRRAAARRTRHPLPEELPEPSEGPPEQITGQEMAARLAEEVAKLPSDFRAPLMLRAEEGMSFRQIAQVIGTTEQTARWRVFKARQKLMQVMGEELGFGDADPHG